MPRLQLKWMAALAAVVTVVIAVSSVLVERSLERKLLTENESELLRRAGLVALWLEERPWADASPAALHELARRAAELAAARVTLIDRDGRVLADSDVPTAELAAVENHAQRPEVRDALAGRAATSRRLSATVKRRLLYGAVPLAASAASGPPPSGPPPSGPPEGVVRLAVDLPALEASVAALRRQFWVAGAIGVAAALVLAFLLSGMLLRPIEAIRETVRALARGEFAARVPWQSEDAFGEVARAIDAMGEQLEARVSELTSEKEQLQAVLRGMVEGVLVVDSTGAIALANRRLRELFGLRGEVEGRAPIEVIRSAEIQKALDSARLSLDPVVLEVELDQLQRRTLRVHAVALRTQAGVGALAVFHDMTEIRRLEAVRRDFVANASHELKTPITAVRGFAETLVSQAVPKADRERYLKIILNHAERMGALVEDLLELSRVESSSIQSDERSALELEPLLRATLRSLDSVFSSRKHTVELGPLAVPKVRAEARALERVLHCLLDNAAKYSEPGGRISIRAQHEGAWVRIFIQDTGIGIPKAHQERIFERFYRVDRARSREAGGTGLGLAIVRHWVERMGGQVGVESEPGRGSTFWFTLPVAG
jgi:two-component system phosphate regulon sensor histidine kinase PhoR